MPQKVTAAKITDSKSSATATSAVLSTMQTPQSPLSIHGRTLQLQQLYGNEGIQRLYKSGLLQAKLKTGKPGDKYEQEADSVAHGVIHAKGASFGASMAEQQVVRQDDNKEEVKAKPLVQTTTPVVQRQAEEEEAQPRLLQRAVRTNGGMNKIKEAEYQKGGSKESVGTKRRVSSLISDGVRRVFDSVPELEDYANGKTDYIGDVVTSSAGTFWYRLPKDKLTVLGENHSDKLGNVPDVILGFKTSRFKHEPLNEFASVAPLDQSKIGTGTKTRLGKINAGRRVGPMIDRKLFNPDLENIVIKALTGAAITRNEFISASPATMGAHNKKKWSGRPTSSDWSYGERTALYLSMAMHIAEDISAYSFGPENFVESKYIKSGRRLKESYKKYKAELSGFMTTKDSDDLIGIYELTSPHGFSILPILKDFTLVFHEYASCYIEQLGSQSGNKALEKHGNDLSGKLDVSLSDLSPAREEIMWENVKEANTKNYLIVGMGDRHRQNLSTRLDKEGIRHKFVRKDLNDQKGNINAGWVP